MDVKTLVKVPVIQLQHGWNVTKLINRTFWFIVFIAWKFGGWKCTCIYIWNYVCASSLIINGICQLNLRKLLFLIKWLQIWWQMKFMSMDEIVEISQTCCSWYYWTCSEYVCVCVFFKVLSILWCSQTGDDLLEDLAKFGYRLKMEVIVKEHPSMFLAS
jgi:hypothetical protein